MWSCDKCTFDNADQSAKTCSMCMSPRTAKPSQPQPQPSRPSPPAPRNDTTPPRTQTQTVSNALSPTDKTVFVWEWQGVDNEWRNIVDFDQKHLEKEYAKKAEGVSLPDTYVDFGSMTMIRGKSYTKVRRREIQAPQSSAPPIRTTPPKSDIHPASPYPPTAPQAKFVPASTPVHVLPEFVRQTSTDVIDTIQWEEQITQEIDHVEALRISCNHNRYCDKIFIAGEAVMPNNDANTTWDHILNAPRSWRIFNPSGPNPAEIRQGELGDCWFLSAVAVVAYRRPDLIADLFLTKTVTKEAVFGVRFWNSGVWTTVVVDGMFPIKYKQFRFGSCSDESVLWVAILEKAYAKMYGSYSAIVSGRCKEALYNLTGAPCEGFDLKHDGSDDVMWANLVSFSTSGCVVGATCGREEILRESQSLGLQTNHCYSFLQAFPIENGDRIVELRNPWGQTKWHGQYQRGTPAHERFIKPILNETYRDDPDALRDPGRLWLTYAEFSRHFTSVEVCRCLPHWNGATLFNAPWMSSGPVSATPICAHLTVTESTECILMLVQPFLRGRPTTETLFDVGLIVSKVDSSESQVHRYYAHEPLRVDEVVRMELHLDPGRYVLMPYSLQAQPHETITVCLYSARKVKASIHEYPSPGTFRTLLTEAILLSPHSKISYPVSGLSTCRCSGEGDRFLALVATNTSDRAVCVETTMEQRGCHVSRRGHHYKDVLSPGARQIIYLSAVA
eukprot:PhF_6_TR10431/c1_g1_i5/m.16464/K08582/CAPN15; calpain-15